MNTINTTTGDNAMTTTTIDLTSDHAARLQIATQVRRLFQTHSSANTAIDRAINAMPTASQAVCGELLTDLQGYLGEIYDAVFACDAIVGKLIDLSPANPLNDPHSPETSEADREIKMAAFGTYLESREVPQ